MNDDLKVFHYSLWAVMVVHGLFIPLFYWLGLPVLAYVNILSLALYIYCVYLFPNAVVKREFGLIGCIVGFEVIAHAYIACYYLGLVSGFQYYIFALVSFPIFGIKGSFQQNILRIALLILAYIVLDLWLTDKPPQVLFDDGWMQVIRYVNLSIFILFSGSVTFAYPKASQLYQNMLTELANIDELTGLKNRRSLIEAAEFEIAENEGIPFSMLVIDIDYFKNINDTYGHLCGDYILANIAPVMQSELRKQDVLGRWGGEEFMVLLPDTDSEVLVQVAERLRLKVAETAFEYNNQEIFISITLGAAVLSKNDTFDLLTSRADGALYQGKTNGRNCWQFASA